MPILDFQRCWVLAMAKLLTDEQHSFLVVNANGRSKGEMAELLKREFGIELTHNQLKGYYKNHKITSGLDMTFKKGGVPANKGTKGKYNVGGNKTSFKPGQRPPNYRPIGSERTDRDGYTLVKVSDTGTSPQRWKLKHRLLWEKQHGVVPKGHVVIFADGDKQNITIDNLILISNRQLAMINKHKLIQNNKEGTKTGLLIADLILKISERKKT
jgi:hypothetical protein